jgi:hypothetical protein
MEARPILTTLAPVDFEAYLISKKIDTVAFAKAERELWQSWKTEFEQIHPNSFTAQKLYLINPLRRKYHLKTVPAPVSSVVNPAPVVAIPVSPATGPASNPKPAIPRPVFKQKPKLS